MTNEEIIEMIKSMKAKCLKSKCEDCKLGYYHGTQVRVRCIWSDLMGELDNWPACISVEKVEEIINL